MGRLFSWHDWYKHATKIVHVSLPYFKSVSWGYIIRGQPFNIQGEGRDIFEINI